MQLLSKTLSTKISIRPLSWDFFWAFLYLYSWISTSFDIYLTHIFIEIFYSVYLTANCRSFLLTGPFSPSGTGDSLASLFSYEFQSSTSQLILSDGVSNPSKFRYYFLKNLYSSRWRISWVYVPGFFMVWGTSSLALPSLVTCLHWWV